MRETVDLQSLYAERRLDKARQEYLRLLNSCTATAQDHLTGSLTLRLLGDLISARDAAQRGLAEKPQGGLRGQLRFMHGTILRELGDIALAITELEECISRLAEYGDFTTLLAGPAWYNLGLALRQAKRYPDSIQAYKTACGLFRRERLHGMLCQALLNMAWVACISGDRALAESSLEESAGLVPDDQSRWHQRIGVAFLQAISGAERQAMDSCEEITRSRDPVPPDVRSHAYWLSGRTALKLGLVDVARALAKQALDHALVAKGENRCLHDASELLRDLAAAAAAGHGSGS